jgi:hypothetical protein
MASALGGLEVLDFSRVLAGPLATMVLGDLGAVVTKVESPAGDDTRQWGPPYDEAGDATYFQSVNRNKDSLVLDLTDAADLERAQRLAGEADVLVENFRPGVTERFGLDYDTLRERNPRLIYCSITGFGAGKGAVLPGYDLLVQALGGLMSITGPADGEPQKVGVALVDVLAGLFSTIGILAALEHRRESGKGHTPSPGWFPSGWATRIRASPRTSHCGAPTATSSWRWATIASSARCARCSGRPSWRAIHASRTTRRGSRIDRRCARRSRSGSPRVRPSPGRRS